MRRFHLWVSVFGALGAGLAGCGDSEGVVHAPVVLVSAAASVADEQCPYGGTVFAMGPDRNGNGVLDADEVESRTWACEEASLSRTREEPAGELCPAGGVVLLTGPDLDGDGELSDEEVHASLPVCFPDGSAGPVLNVVEAREDLAGACAQGAVSIHWGRDANRDGELSEDERALTTMACNVPPHFKTPDLLTVDSCAGEFRVQLLAEHEGETAIRYQARTLHSGATADVQVSADGWLSVAPGAHRGVAYVEAQALDDFGGVAVMMLTLVFSGEDCVPLDTLYGALPETCEEIDLQLVVGEPTGGVVLVRNYAFIPGEDGMVRVSRASGAVERVWEHRMDMVFSDEGSHELYVFLHRGENYSWLSDAESASFDLFAGGIERFARLDEESLEQGDPIDLEVVPPIGTSRLSSFDGEELPFKADAMMIGARDGQLAMALIGEYVSGPLGGTAAILYLVYSLEDGSLLSWRILDEHIPESESLPWLHYYAGYRVLQQPVFGQGDALTIMYQALPSYQWYTLNLWEGTPELWTGTFASYCYLPSLSVDLDAAEVWGRTPHSCYGRDYDAWDTLFHCKILTEPNDGSWYDQGIPMSE